MGGGEQSNAATYFIVLKNWNERKGKEHTAEAVVQRFNMEVYGIQEAEIFAMVPPAIPGLGATGGLQLQLEDRHNLGATEMQRAVETLMEHYRNYPALASVSSQYQANVPQYFLNIDRDKVQLMGIPLNSVFTALGYYCLLYTSQLHPTDCCHARSMQPGRRNSETLPRFVQTRTYSLPERTGRTTLTPDIRKSAGAGTRQLLAASDSLIPGIGRWI